jgi:carbonic anhydrase/acetyltransferase-like protein (isoleucine patch superfamily)
VRHGRSAALAPLVIFGAGGAAASVVDIATHLGHPILGSVDDVGPVPPGTCRLSHPVAQALEEVKGRETAQDAEVVIAHGSGAERLRIATKVQLTGGSSGRAVRFATLIRPEAFISTHAVVGEDSVVGFASLVGAGSEVGDHVMVLNAVIGHDNRIGSGVTLSPGVTIAGGACIGERTTVGMHASV